MRNFSYSGQSLTFTATEPLTSGQLYNLGSAFGIVSNTLSPGDSGELFLTGVWILPKDSSETKVGDRLYWNPAEKILTSKTLADGSTKLVGMAAEDAASTKTTVLCRLNGVTL